MLNVEEVCCGAEQLERIANLFCPSPEIDTIRGRSVTIIRRGRMRPPP